MKLLVLLLGCISVNAFADEPIDVKVSTYVVSVGKFDLASVMFHVAMLSSLPSLAYLTLGDRIMIAIYMTIGLNRLQSVRMLYLVLKKEQPKVDAIFHHTCIMVPAFCAVAYGVGIATRFL